MTKKSYESLSRRGFLAGSAALIGAPVLANVENAEQPEYDPLRPPPKPEPPVRHNISSFRTYQWQPYFSNLRGGAILVDTVSRALHFWGEDQVTYDLYPCSVPLTDELTRRGRTSVIQKVTGPSWAPTPSKGSQ